VRKFLLSITAFALLTVVIDRGLGRALRWLWERPGNADVDDLDAGARRRPQIAISGSSRARNHYVADSLERDLGRRVHNFGRGGQFSSVFQYAVAEIVLAQGVPDLWVIEADARLYRGSDSDKLAELLPYANRNAAVREALATRSRLERLKFWSRTYPYNSLVLNLVRASLFPTRAVPRNGFNAIHGRMKPGDRADPIDAAQFFPPVEPVKMEYLRRLVDTLRARGVRVLAVRSPFYAGDAETRALLRREGQELAAVFASMRVPFIDASWEQYPEFSSPAAFANRRHLNERGALRFSHILADSMSRLLSRPPARAPGAEPCVVTAGAPRSSPGARDRGAGPDGPAIAALGRAPDLTGC
jgi:hypothetical protein